MNTEEQWLAVVGYEGLYEVSDLGRVRALPPRWTTRLKTGEHLLRLHPHPSGHLRTSLRGSDDKHRHWLAHVLVITAFIGKKPSVELECRHLDGDPTHNTPSNLQWGTHSENMLDKVTHGTHHNSIKTHCNRGHEFDEANTRLTLKSNGRTHRQCKECARRFLRESRARRKATQSNA